MAPWVGSEAHTRDVPLGAAEGSRPEWLRERSQAGWRCLGVHQWRWGSRHGIRPPCCGSDRLTKVPIARPERDEIKASDDASCFFVAQALLKQRPLLLKGGLSKARVVALNSSREASECASEALLKQRPLSLKSETHQGVVDGP